MENSKKHLPFEIGKRYKVLGQQDKWFTISSIQLNKSNEVDFFMGRYDDEDFDSMLSGSRLVAEKQLPFLTNQFLNIVALGYWNKKVFTPEWVKNNVFELSDEEKMYIQFNHDELRFGYTYNNVFIIVDDNALELVIKEDSDETIKQATKYFTNILNLLPHTPLRAIAFNFNADVFNYESKLTEQINSIFLNQGEYSLREVHLIQKSDKFLLNISANDIRDGLKLKFNFHYEGLIELTGDSLVSHREQINQLLTK